MSLGRRLGDLVALGAASVSVVYGIYLLFVGTVSTSLTPEGVAGTTKSPTLAGLLPLGIGLLAFWAIAKRRSAGLWVAAGVAFVFAVVFLFSYSLQFAALGVLLLVAAALRTASERDAARN